MCDGRSFQIQLDLFHTLPDMAMNKQPSLESCCNIMTSMVPEMRALFNFVEVLMVLLLVNPASSAMAERSFSSFAASEDVPAINVWSTAT